MNSNYPKIIYKFRHWNNLECREFDRHPLTHRTLYLASPKDFNDPFDCRIPIDFSLLDTEKKKQDYVDDLIKKLSPLIKSNNMNLESEMKQMSDRVRDIETYQKEYENMKFGSNNEKLGILSLSTSWEEILMWSHYADNHQGYCVGFDEYKMRYSKLFGMGGLVHYPVDYEMPRINPLDRSNLKEASKIEFTKSKNWKYEQEYRLTKRIECTEERIKKIPDDYLKEVIIGCNSSKEAIVEIMEAVSDLKIPVYQAEKIPFQFSLRRKRLN
jgi:hypothetical protein